MGAFRSIAGDPGLVRASAPPSTTSPTPWTREFAREFQESTITRPLAPGQLEDVIAESGKLPVRVWKAALEGLLDAVPPTEAGTDRGADPHPLGRPATSTARATSSCSSTEAIHGAELLVYEGTGHAVHWEEPARAAADIAAFASPRGPRRPRLAAVR